jgi:hypothetical protein
VFSFSTEVGTLPEGISVNAGDRVLERNDLCTESSIGELIKKRLSKNKDLSDMRG